MISCTQYEISSRTLITFEVCARQKHCLGLGRAIAKSQKNALRQWSMQADNNSKSVKGCFRQAEATVLGKAED